MTRSVAVLGPGGVGGFLAGALARAGTPVTVVAREETAEAIERDGLRVQSVRLGDFTVRPAATAELTEPVAVLVVATKAPGLDAALSRVQADVGLVVPLLNGLEHLAPLRERFGPRAVAATIRIAAERIAPGHVVHSSPSVRVELAPPLPAVDAFADLLRTAEVPAVVLGTTGEVLWSKLARLNPLACTTAASARPIGGVRAHPLWRARLQGAVDETAAVAAAEGAPVDADVVLRELEGIPDEATSSLARDLAGGADSELDAIPGAVLRRAAAHGIACPAIEELVALIRDRYRLP